MFITLSHPGFINSIECTDKRGRGAKPMKEIQPHLKCGNGEAENESAVSIHNSKLLCWF